MAYYFMCILHVSERRDLALQSTSIINIIINPLMVLDDAIAALSRSPYIEHYQPQGS
jgi:hypothetical protein